MKSVRVLSAAVLLIAIFVLVSILASTPQKNTVEAKSSTSSNQQRQRPVADSPNAVANSLTLLAYHSGQTMDTIAATSAKVTSHVAQSTKTGILAVASGVQNGATATARGIGGGISLVGRGIGGGVSAVVKFPGKVLGTVTEAPIISNFIRPADHAEDVPVIDPDSPELRAALAALPAEEKSDKKPSGKDPGPQWPVRGRITTQFGVSHWPYQHTHTGMDITDGSVPGTTPVKPFRSGTVTEANNSGYGLGNHVIVDHGSGVTSVYAHLNSISVQVGQKVSLDTTIGMQGTTGVSTGTHLHFEIRVNGKAADPRQFIPGTP